MPVPLNIPPMSGTGACLHNVRVTSLQFIVAMKWPLLALILAAGLAWLIRRSSAETRTAVRSALLGRGLKVGLPGGIELDWQAVSAQAVSAAAAPDKQIAQSMASGADGATDEQVQQYRRLVVEQVVREAAQWGWSMARGGFGTPPVPRISWVDDQPVISVGAAAPSDPVAVPVAVPASDPG